MDNYQPINPNYPHILHGGDYNPEQWMEYEGIWDEDMRLMKLANCNAMTVGIFSWAVLEPEEGRFCFDFLDTIMDRLDQNGMKAVLATPSGARPAWLSAKYPEVLRTDENRVKHLHGGRHNHCLTSPVYREKVQKINRLLAERYRNHPALLAWHISNEYSGCCHCDLCQEAFREWLKKKYKNDLDELNRQWWTTFWSHTYTAWEQIESPSPIGESQLHGLLLDWNRFVTDQTVSFIENEIAPIRELTPDIPVTTNLMSTYPGLNYHKVQEMLDVVSWDSYPLWHKPDENVQVACQTAFYHDLMRGLKDGKPFMLMESTPSLVNWAPINKLKRPGMHKLSSLQAVAHGADTVQYFQWRKSRGSCEKFHGAVVDHCGHENTRVFGEVSALGETLNKLDGVVGTCVKSDAALIYDWENGWGINGLQGLNRFDKKYEETCRRHYESFWKRGINLNVIDSLQDFSNYKLVVAPMLYMIRPGVADRIEAYVKAGGTFVATYLTGMVNENDLCFLGGFPAGQLKDVFGIWNEEIDSLYETENNTVRLVSCAREYRAVDYCELIHADKAEVLAEYATDFYAGTPALTKNMYGKGTAYYIAFRDDGCFVDDFYGCLASDLDILSNLPGNLPHGVTAHTREDGRNRFWFIENYNQEPCSVRLGDGAFWDMERGISATGTVTLEPFGIRILKQSFE